MKRQMILAVAIIFTLALFAPAASYAFKASTTPVVVVDNKEKKEVAKTSTQTENKTEATTTGETKPCCDKAGTAGCCKGAAKSEAKANSGEVKACTGEKKACCAASKTDK